MSSHLLLLMSTVVMDGFYPSLLCYHYSDVVVATGKMPSVTIKAYDLFLPTTIERLIRDTHCSKLETWILHHVLQSKRRL
jgi:hypothetical protein